MEKTVPAPGDGDDLKSAWQAFHACKRARAETAVLPARDEGDVCKNCDYKGSIVMDQFNGPTCTACGVVQSDLFVSEEAEWRTQRDEYTGDRDKRQRCGDGSAPAWCNELADMRGMSTQIRKMIHTQSKVSSNIGQLHSGVDQELIRLQQEFGAEIREDSWNKTREKAETIAEELVQRESLNSGKAPFAESLNRADALAYGEAVARISFMRTCKRISQRPPTSPHTTGLLVKLDIATLTGMTVREEVQRFCNNMQNAGLANDEIFIADAERVVNEAGAERWPRRALIAFMTGNELLRRQVTNRRTFRRALFNSAHAKPSGKTVSPNLDFVEEYRGVVHSALR